jgi:phosphoribosylamine--glycine ligase
MKLLVIGSGGREHAMAWKLAQSPKVQKVFVAPGNGGTATESGLENVELTAIADLVAFARKGNVQLTVVGPEAPLAAVRRVPQHSSSHPRTSPSRSW